jgi:hypothetical protein
MVWELVVPSGTSPKLALLGVGTSVPKMPLPEIV